MRRNTACLLIGSFLKQGMNGIIFANSVSLLLRGAFLALAVLFFYGLTRLFLRIFTLVQVHGDIGLLLIGKLLSMLFLILLSMLIFSAMLTSLPVLFSGKETAFLDYLPVGKKSLYAYFLTKNALLSSWYIMILGFPIFLAYGLVFKKPSGYFALAFLVLLLFSLLANAVGLALTTIIVRLLPSRRIKQVFLLLGLFSVIYAITFFRLAHPERLYSSIGVFEFLVMVKDAGIPQNRFLPYEIASELLAKLELMTVGQGVFNVGKLAGYVLVLIAAGYGLFSLFYRKAHLKYKESGDMRRTIKQSARFNHGSSWLSLLHKDVLLFFREVEQWSQLFILLSLVVIYVINLKAIPMVSMVIRNGIILLNVSFIGFIVSAIVLRFGFPAYSLETRYRWLLTRSCLRRRGILAAKLVFALVPAVGMSCILSLVSGYLLDLDIHSMVYFFFLNLVVAFVIAFIGVSAGILLPKSGDNPMQIAMGVGGVVYLVACLFYIGVINVLLARPYRYDLALKYIIRRSFMTRGFITYNLLILGVSTAACLICYRLVVRKVFRGD